MKLRCNISVVYDANPRDYDTGDPESMAREDEQVFVEGGIPLGQFIDDASEVLSVEFEPYA